eukprot:TRINITY_DN25392_c0_g1_i3.p1 TRINITY_DN25392_c0_g1~~TRINITY_DN25392_c0_g1_i3.p1  ORF type:complete len:2717 (+),score=708.95 TRINITY_DN25392_c0_g1_i3:435-8153(+)
MKQRLAGEVPGVLSDVLDRLGDVESLRESHGKLKRDVRTMCDHAAELSSEADKHTTVLTTVVDKLNAVTDTLNTLVDSNNNLNHGQEALAQRVSEVEACAQASPPPRHSSSHAPQIQALHATVAEVKDELQSFQATVASEIGSFEEKVEGQVGVLSGAVQKVGEEEHYRMHQLQAAVDALRADHAKQQRQDSRRSEEAVHVCPGLLDVESRLDAVEAAIDMTAHQLPAARTPPGDTAESEKRVTDVEHDVKALCCRVEAVEKQAAQQQGADPQALHQCQHLAKRVASVEAKCSGIDATVHDTNSNCEVLKTRVLRAEGGLKEVAVHLREVDDKVSNQSEIPTRRGASGSPLLVPPRPGNASLTSTVASMDEKIVELGSAVHGAVQFNESITKRVSIFEKSLQDIHAKVRRFSSTGDIVAQRIISVEEALRQVNTRGPTAPDTQMQDVESDIKAMKTTLAELRDAVQGATPDAEKPSAVGVEDAMRCATEAHEVADNAMRQIADLCTCLRNMPQPRQVKELADDILLLKHDLSAVKEEAKASDAQAAARLSEMAVTLGKAPTPHTMVSSIEASVGHKASELLTTMEEISQRLQTYIETQVDEVQRSVSGVTKSGADHAASTNARFMSVAQQLREVEEKVSEFSGRSQGNTDLAAKLHSTDTVANEAFEVSKDAHRSAEHTSGVLTSLQHQVDALASTTSDALARLDEAVHTIRTEERETANVLERRLLAEQQCSEDIVASLAQRTSSLEVSQDRMSSVVQTAEENQDAALGQLQAESKALGAALSTTDRALQLVRGRMETLDQEASLSRADVDELRCRITATEASLHSASVHREEDVGDLQAILETRVAGIVHDADTTKRKVDHLTQELADTKQALRSREAASEAETQSASAERQNLEKAVSFRLTSIENKISASDLTAKVCAVESRLEAVCGLQKQQHDELADASSAREDLLSRIGCVEASGVLLQEQLSTTIHGVEAKMAATSDAVSGLGQRTDGLEASAERVRQGVQAARSEAAQDIERARCTAAEAHDTALRVIDDAVGKLTQSVASVDRAIREELSHLHAGLRDEIRFNLPPQRGDHVGASRGERPAGTPGSQRADVSSSGMEEMRQWMVDEQRAALVSLRKEVNAISARGAENHASVLESLRTLQHSVEQERASRATRLEEGLRRAERQAVASLQPQVDSLSMEVERCAGNYAGLQQVTDGLQGSHSQLSHAVTAIRERTVSIESEMSSHAKSQRVAQAQTAHCTESLEGVQRTVDHHSRHFDTLEASIAKVTHSNDAIAGVDQQLKVLKARHEEDVEDARRASNKRAQDVDDDLLRVRREGAEWAETVQNEVSGLRSILTALRSDVVDTQVASSGAEARVAELQDLLRAQERTLTKHSDALRVLRENGESLSALVDNQNDINTGLNKSLASIEASVAERPTLSDVAGVCATEVANSERIGTVERALHSLGALRGQAAEDTALRCDALARDLNRKLSSCEAEVKGSLRHFEMLLDEKTVDGQRTAPVEFEHKVSVMEAQGDATQAFLENLLRDVEKLETKLLEQTANANGEGRAAIDKLSQIVLGLQQQVVLMASDGISEQVASTIRRVCAVEEGLASVSDTICKTDAFAKREVDALQAAADELNANQLASVGRLDNLAAELSSVFSKVACNEDLAKRSIAALQADDDSISARVGTAVQHLGTLDKKVATMSALISPGDDERLLPAALHKQMSALQAQISTLSAGVAEVQTSQRHQESSKADRRDTVSVTDVECIRTELADVIQTVQNNASLALESVRTLQQEDTQLSSKLDDAIERLAKPAAELRAIDAAVSSFAERLAAIEEHAAEAPTIDAHVVETLQEGVSTLRQQVSGLGEEVADLHTAAADKREVVMLSEKVAVLEGGCFTVAQGDAQAEAIAALSSQVATQEGELLARIELTERPHGEIAAALRNCVTLGAFTTSFDALRADLVLLQEAHAAASATFESCEGRIGCVEAHLTVGCAVCAKTAERCADIHMQVKELTETVESTVCVGQRVATVETEVGRAKQRIDDCSKASRRHLEEVSMLSDRVRLLEESPSEAQDASSFEAAPADEVPLQAIAESVQELGQRLSATEQQSVSACGQLQHLAVRVATYEEKLCTLETAATSAARIPESDTVSTTDFVKKSVDACRFGAERRVVEVEGRCSVRQKELHTLLCSLGDRVDAVEAATQMTAFVVDSASPHRPPSVSPKEADNMSDVEAKLQLLRSDLESAFGERLTVVHATLSKTLDMKLEEHTVEVEGRVSTQLRNRDRIPPQVAQPGQPVDSIVPVTVFEAHKEETSAALQHLVSSVNAVTRTAAEHGSLIQNLQVQCADVAANPDATVAVQTASLEDSIRRLQKGLQLVMADAASNETLQQMRQEVTDLQMHSHAAVRSLQDADTASEICLSHFRASLTQFITADQIASIMEGALQEPVSELRVCISRELEERAGAFQASLQGTHDELVDRIADLGTDVSLLKESSAKRESLEQRVKAHQKDMTSWAEQLSDTLQTQQAQLASPTTSAFASHFEALRQTIGDQAQRLDDIEVEMSKCVKEPDRFVSASCP